MENNRVEYKVSFEMILPETGKEPTEKDVIDWLKYHLAITSELKGTNPLVESEFSDIEIDYLSVKKSS